MFGQMAIAPVLEVSPQPELNGAVTESLKITETAEIIRWIEFPAPVLLFLLVPGDPKSGAVYILDRKKGTWYAIDFEDDQFGGYSVSQLEQLLRECRFLDLVERPSLWRTGLRWYVESGRSPESRV